MAAAYCGERTEFRKLSAKVTGRKQFSTSSVFVVLRCATILCPVNSVLSLARVGHRVCNVGRNTRSRAASESINWNSTARCTYHQLPHASSGDPAARKTTGPTMVVRPRFTRCRNCTLFLAKFIASALYKYLVSLVLACLLGMQDEAPLIIRSGPIYRAPVSDRDLFDAPSRARTTIISPFPILADVNFKGNFEEWFLGFPGMIVVRKGWNVIKGWFEEFGVLLWHRRVAPKL